MRIKILMLVRDLATGTETYTHNLVRSLQKYDVTLVVGEVGGTRGIFPCESVSLCSCLPSRLDRMDIAPALRLLIVLGRMPVIIRKFKPHVLFVQGLDELALIATLASKVFGIPAVSFVHDLTLWELRLRRRGHLATIMHSLALWRQRFNSERLAETLVASTFMRSALREMLGLNPTKAELGVSSSFFLQPGLDKPFKVIFVGSLTEKKMVQTAVRALAHIADSSITLAVVGEGPARKKLDKLAHELGVENRVTFMGHLKQEELYDQLSRSSVCVAPSMWEGFGLAPLECMAAGLPVIASSSGALKEIVRDGFNGYLVRVGDYVAMAGRISELSRDKQKLESMSSNAREWARRYSWDSTAEKTISALADVLKKN